MMPYATDYFQIFLIAAPFLIMNMTCANAIIAEGNSKVAMGTMAMGAVLNIILDPIFIKILDLGRSRCGNGHHHFHRYHLPVSGHLFISGGKVKFPLAGAFSGSNFPLSPAFWPLDSPAFAREGAMSISIGLLNNAPAHLRR